MKNLAQMSESPVAAEHDAELSITTSISPTSRRFCKAIATQIAKLAMEGHAVHQLKDGDFLVCKDGYTFHEVSFAELQAFAGRLGVHQ